MKAPLKLIAALGIALAAACAADPVTIPEGSPLAGLNETAVRDSTNQPIGNSGHVPTGSGYFRGTVVAPALPGSGNDSLNTAPRIAGVVVTIYERKGDGDDPASVGDAKGTVTTGTDGKWTLPTLPAGDYVVTFVPPPGSGYHGAYGYGPLHQGSHEFQWWIVLARK
jgi:hypothetical protein